MAKNWTISLRSVEMDMSRVIVIGGGLAGMMIAYKLADRNVPVVLLESDDKLGGKAGARRNSSYKNAFEDHGYHIIPAWYVNMRSLLHKLEIDKNLIDFHRVHYLRRNAFPKFNTLLEPNYPKNFIHNVFRFGLVHWSVQFLCLYAALDLASQTLKKRAMLDQISVTGYLRSRWYRTEDVANFQNQQLLQASSIASYLIGAMTARKVLSSYYKYGTPFHSVLDNNLQETLIEPLRQHLEQRGVQILLRHTVTGLKLIRDRIVTLTLAQGDAFKAQDNDIYVITTPPDIVYSFVNEEIVVAEARYAGDAETKLSDLVHLQLTPMAAMHVYFNRTMSGFPREHVVLYGSRYQISFIDISQIWRNQKGERVYDKTVLSVIASGYAPLRNLRPGEAKKCLLNELLEYVPISDKDIDHVEIQSNVERPLFLNTIGSWPYRPKTKARLKNLYLAGDYCRSQADLTTMEGCIEAATKTASHVLQALGHIEEGLEVKEIRTPCRICMRVMYWLASPAAAIVWVIAKLKEPDQRDR
jgi:uncharacterized protein with NAD-binding domain and iron-sulfur cluster